MERLLSAENYPFEGFREFRRTTVAVPCSKSVAQRAVLAAALAAGESRLANYAPCNDIVGAVEVIRGVAGSIGIVLTVPLVALLSSRFMGPQPKT